MWRRALVSMAAMLGVSALFVGVVMLVLGSIVDMAVSPSEGNVSVEAAASPGPSEASKGSASKGPSGPGGRS